MVYCKRWLISSKPIARSRLRKNVPFIENGKRNKAILGVVSILFIAVVFSLWGVIRAGVAPNELFSPLWWHVYYRIFVDRRAKTILVALNKYFVEH